MLVVIGQILPVYGEYETIQAVDSESLVLKKASSRAVQKNPNKKRRARAGESEYAGIARLGNAHPAIVAALLIAILTIYAWI